MPPQHPAGGDHYRRQRCAGGGADRVFGQDQISDLKGTASQIVGHFAHPLMHVVGEVRDDAIG